MLTRAAHILQTARPTALRHTQRYLSSVPPLPNMTTNLSHSPPSSPSSNPAKKVKLSATSDATELPSTIDGHLGEASGVAEPAKEIKARSRGKESHGKASKAKGVKLLAPEAVLLYDILAVTGWKELPKAVNGEYTIDPAYGKTKWPSMGPRDLAQAEEGTSGEPASKAWTFTKDTFHVTALTSHGDGIAAYPPAPEVAQCAVIIPFALPGDVVEAQVTRHLQFHSFAEPLSLPSTSTPLPSTSSFPLTITRDNSLIGCKYFGKCGGCQFQSLPYDQQLALKRLTLQKAMRNFSGLAPEEIPDVKETIASPKQYAYRTKITPHFQLPKSLVKPRRGYKNGIAKKEKPVDDAEIEDVPIGFEEKCRSRIIDVEECPIATEVINQRMPEVRARVKSTIREFKNGATMLFRDSLVVKATSSPAAAQSAPVPDVTAPSTAATADVEMDEEELMMNANGDGQGEVEIQTTTPAVRKGKGKALPALSRDFEVVNPEEHLCVTDHHHTVTERVGDILFQFPAGSFFQNNSSILLPLTDFVRDQISHDTVSNGEETYLVDAYCGSGLFSLTLAGHFTKVCGIEIDPASIHYAAHNALLNNLTNVAFHTGASEDIFQPIINKLDWAGEKTTLIVDPPRKGCDDGFLKQVVKFAPRRVVYVSCNVHTMAANVGDLIRWSAEASPTGQGYKITSLGAIDLFPQTHHTEGLCVLERAV